jgi:TRAP-type C4-dicarboxylate transport system permease small subunit
MQFIFRIDRWLEKVERLMIVALFTILTATIAISIFARNVLHTAAHGLLELSPVAVLWLALSGAGLALKYHRHIKIDLLQRFLPPRWRRLSVIVTSLFGMLVMGVLTYAAVDFITNEISLFGGRGWLSLCFPLFCLTAFFRFFLQLLSPRGSKALVE